MASAKDGKPKRKQPRAGTNGERQRNREASKRPAVAIDEEEAARVPRNRDGKKLPAAAAELRDTLMLTRLAQGWPLSAIAEEANLNERTVRRAIDKKVKRSPLVLSIDPVKVVEDVALGLQLSIGDFEALAWEAMRNGRGHLSAAVGAKKGANEARAQVIQLLQDVGRLPRDLSAVKQLLELREIASAMASAVHSLREEVEKLDAPDDVRERYLREVDRVEKVFVEQVDPPTPTLAA